MDTGYSWKRTQEAETDLKDLLCRLLRQWKQIAVCAVISAAVLGGYGRMKDAEEKKSAALAAEGEAVLTEAEEQAVADAVLLEKQIGGLEIYLEHSVLMQLDAYHRNKLVMLFCIKDAKGEEFTGIIEGYLNYILNGGAAETMAESGCWQKDKSYLSELITAYQKESGVSNQTVLIDGQADIYQKKQAFFYVEVTGTSEKETEKMASAMQDALKKYSSRVKKAAGSHTLELINSMKSVIADSGLQSQQYEKRMLLSSYKTNLRTMTSSFSEKQTVSYLAAIGAEEGKDTPDDTNSSEKLISDSQPVLGMKYIFIGLAAGIFLYGFIFSCSYVFGDTVKSTKEMKDLYLFPVYGSILLPGRKRNQGVLAAAGQQSDKYEHTKMLTVNRLRLACSRMDVKKFCAVSDFVFSEQEKECLESIVKQLQVWGIEMKPVENGVMNAEIWDELTETGNVLMICRTGTTTHGMIDDAMKFYQENNIAVFGAAVFSKNG